MNNTTNLIDANFAFSNCISLEKVNLPNELIYLEYIENMFENYIKLASINLGFLQEDSNLSITRGMFKGCSSLIEIIFPPILIYKISDASEMFMGCANLTNINLEGIIQIGSMDSILYDCKCLKYLNIKNVNTMDNYNFQNIFEGIEKKIEIIYNKYITGPKLQLEIYKNKRLPVE